MIVGKYDVVWKGLTRIVLVILLLTEVFGNRHQFRVERHLVYAKFDIEDRTFNFVVLQFATFVGAYPPPSDNHKLVFVKKDSMTMPSFIHFTKLFPLFRGGIERDD